MNFENLENVINGIEKRASGMQRVAAFYFVFAIGALIGAGFIFYNLEVPTQNDSDFKFGALIALNLFLRLAITVFAFYIVRLIMSIVSYNLSLSNDLFAKADSLYLISKNENISFSDLTEHMSVKHHRFHASEDFSGSAEFNTLISALKASGVKPNTSDKDA
ncbi:hypothetical protein WMY97_12205 [Vibrio diabolicus]|uniref:hypothetical protein n=1 Tax=Vibrio harveyi group TaxID=717610 RepID=UPI00111E4EE8|nr:hypothetical protein [Vibrio parahaemolyticus]MCR9982848.1 hypothetical protein [Vibrio alginolyticus]MDG3414871.1 hypothetical protein [Vibrio parahaemolyticus]TOK94663.1 hypothetical protein CGI06_24960 [Vibrio parahaemolyticus]HCE5203324.1 hypothetical protein [Vibrio parahaemolyticus]